MDNNRTSAGIACTKTAAAATRRSNGDHLDYMLQMLVELRLMAASAEMPMLVYLLEMAILEAKEGSPNGSAGPVSG